MAESPKCDADDEERMLFRGNLARIAAAEFITEYYGERCRGESGEYEASEGCVVCQKWQAFDSLFTDC